MLKRTPNLTPKKKPSKPTTDDEWPRAPKPAKQPVERLLYGLAYKIDHLTEQFDCMRADLGRLATAKQLAQLRQTLQEVLHMAGSIKDTITKLEAAYADIKADVDTLRSNTVSQEDLDKLNQLAVNITGLIPNEVGGEPAPTPPDVTPEPTT